MLARLRRLDPALLLACASFVAFGLWGAHVLPAGHEEISTFPGRSTRVIVEQERSRELTFERHCAEENAPLFVRSEARPTLSLCARGLSLPVLIASYASGVPYWHALLSWPLHGGDAFGMRRWNLLAGLLSLLLLYRLVRRLSDETTAAVAVLVLAVSSPFVVLHSLLLQYESMPWLLTIAALLLALGPVGSRGGTPPRLVLAGAVAGLAIVANVKACFLLAPVPLIAWRSGALRHLPRRLLLEIAGATALGTTPLLVANWVHGGGGLGEQTSRRTQLLLRGTSIDDVVGELINMVRFASDTGSYGIAKWQPLGALGVLAAALSALGALYVVVVLLRFLRTGEASDATAAYCATIVLGFVVVSLTLYDQRPAANYAPVHAVFATMVALGVVASGRFLARSRYAALSSVRRNALVLGAVGMSLLGAVTALRLDAGDALPLSTNARAERALVDYLVRHPERGATLYTTTYNLAGVIDSLGRGELATVRLDRVVHCGDDDAQAEACVAARWRTFFEMPGALPARIVVPAVESFVDEPDAMSLAPALRDAAQAAGVSLVVEHEITLEDRGAALTLFRVERAR